MGEWQVVGISFNNSYLTKTSWQRIADIIGGEVKTASLVLFIDLMMIALMD